MIFMSLILLIQELHPKVRYNRAQLLHSESKNQSRECRDCFKKISFILQGEQGPEYRLLHKGENLTEIFFFFFTYHDYNWLPFLLLFQLHTVFPKA